MAFEPHDRLNEFLLFEGFGRWSRVSYSARASNSRARATWLPVSGCVCVCVFFFFFFF